MPVPAVINQIAQIGKEETPGRAVAPTKRIGSFSIELGPEMEIQQFRPQGAKFATTYILNQEWSSLSYDGILSYDDVVYPLAGCFSDVTPTPVFHAGEVWEANTAYEVGQFVVPTTGTPNNLYEVTVGGTTDAVEPTWPTTADATVVSGTVTFRNAGAAPTEPVAYDWVFDINDLGRDDIATFTVETGDSQLGRANRAAYMHFLGFSVSSTRAGEFSISGDAVAKILEPVTLTTTGIEEKPIVPASPRGVNIYIDDSHETLGSRKLRHNFTFEEELGDRFGQAWFHDRDEESFAEHYETEPSLSVSMTIADDEGLDEWITQIREGQNKLVRFDSLGPEISDGVHYEFVWDTSVSVSDAYSYGDEDGARSAELELGAMRDPRWGRTTRIRVRNTVSEL